MPALDAERRSRLLGVKLTALASQLDPALAAGAASTFPGGAAVASGATAAVLLDEQPGRGLGRALAWARQAGATAVHVLVDDDAGLLARRAAAFAVAPTVWWVRGRDLHRIEPEPLPSSPAAPAAALELVPVLEAAGCDVVVEHGEVTGEVLGLEVARVVMGDGFVAIQAGVGRHDRDAFAMMHGDLPAPEALAKVVAAVRSTRRADGPDHPLHRLTPERWLRDVVVANPDLVGAAAGSLHRHEGPAPRPNLKDPWPAVAVGAGVVVVCSVGIDLDLVPYATDARLAAAQPDARLVLVVPERDAHDVTRALAAALSAPAEVVTVPSTWRTLLQA